MRSAAERLARAGVPNPTWDAELLLRHVLDWDRATLLSRASEAVAAEAAARLEAMVRRREKREPLQYITGRQAFWHHEFHVTPDVLIPRPETELLVERTLQLLKGRARPVIADVGTGSGCIAISLALALPGAFVHALDSSPRAVALARDNAVRLGASERMAFHCGNLLEPLPVDVVLDTVVSNPPYVDTAYRSLLPQEVLAYEPPEALFPPGEATSVYRELAPQAMARLRPGGALVVEIGHGMEAAVAAVVGAAGFEAITVTSDLQSIPRCLSTVKPR